MAGSEAARPSTRWNSAGFRWPTPGSEADVAAAATPGSVVSSSSVRWMRWTTAIVVPDLVVTAAHVKGQYVTGVESRIHARQLVETSEKESCAGQKRDRQRHLHADQAP